jgi:hypothetical protein
MRSILLIDDDESGLNQLAEGLKARLPAGQVEIRTWVPTKEDEDPRGAFEKRLDAETTLVVTDHDLTSRGLTGLFGASIVAWCQTKRIPVGDFSRRTANALTKEPDLFEFRVPTDPQRSVVVVASVFSGFAAISNALKTRPVLLTKRSPAAVLADILGPPADENQFTLYGVRFGTTIGALLDTITPAADRPEPGRQDKIHLLTYIVGHLLLNAVLRFPGPILSQRALKAYASSDEADAADVQQLFETATYAGPFGDLEEPFFWLAKVDDVLDGLMKELAADVNTETSGELRRLAIEKKLSRRLARHACNRCNGVNGGFYCPFTKRTVCERPDCSVGSSSWIPQGAKACRIERDFFDEWAPILGL